MQERLTKEDRYGHIYTNKANCRNVWSKDGENLEGVYFENHTLAIDGAAIEKLGKIEDLMEKYQIKDIEMLEKMIVRHDKYCNLEENIGCPIDVVVKALKGFYYINNVGGLSKAEKPITITFDEASKVYYLESGDYEWTPYQSVPLTLYKKAFWLKEDKSE
jgi:hypothetical protein